MGVSVIQTDRLFWLGRYLERVYTTFRLYFKEFDKLIDTGVSFHDFCLLLDIEDVYTSSEDFLKRYAFSTDLKDSLLSNLLRAHDNAIVLREEIGSDALSYVELAIYTMRKAAVSDAPMFELHALLDYLMAFWGITDDQIESENVRNILKVGKRVERIDLFARMKEERSKLQREVHRLEGRIIRCDLRYDEKALKALHEMVEMEKLPYSEIVNTVETFLEA